MRINLQLKFTFYDYLEEGDQYTGLLYTLEKNVVCLNLEQNNFDIIMIISLSHYLSSSCYETPVTV
jgi:hypothetical protein